MLGGRVDAVAERREDAGHRRRRHEVALAAGDPARQQRPGRVDVGHHVDLHCRAQTSSGASAPPPWATPALANHRSIGPWASSTSRTRAIVAVSSPTSSARATTRSPSSMPSACDVGGDDGVGPGGDERPHERTSDAARGTRDDGDPVPWVHGGDPTSASPRGHVRRRLYQLVETCYTWARDRRGAGADTDRHHGIDGVRRDGAGRTAAARGAGCELVLLVRDGKRTPAARRVQRELLKNDAFDRLRAELAEAGGETFDEMAARRITTIAGDVGTDGLGLSEPDRAVLASCDIVIHSAAAVSFDSPLDSAVEINLLGPTRIAELLQRARRHAAPRVRVDVLRRRQPPRHGTRGARQRRAVRPRAELARRGRRRPPPARRRRGGEPPARTSSSSSAPAARTELGAAGAPALAAKTEQLRERWVRDRLVEAGRARAASVGWPDAYAFTKALGEQALTDSQGRRAGQHRAPVDHRVGVGRAAPGLDPRLPHGRAGADLLRPRPAARVPRRARGDRRRDPGRPRRRGDHHRRRPRPGAGAGRSPRSRRAASTR